MNAVAEGAFKRHAKQTLSFKRICECILKKIDFRSKICCKSERNQEEILQIQRGRREEGVGSNLNFPPNMRDLPTGGSIQIQLFVEAKTSVDVGHWISQFRRNFFSAPTSSQGWWITFYTRGKCLKASTCSLTPQQNLISYATESAPEWHLQDSPLATLQKSLTKWRKCKLFSFQNQMSEPSIIFLNDFKDNEISPYSNLEV